MQVIDCRYDTIKLREAFFSMKVRSFPTMTGRETGQPFTEPSLMPVVK